MRTRGHSFFQRGGLAKAETQWYDRDYAKSVLGYPANAFRLGLGCIAWRRCFRNAGVAPGSVECSVRNLGGWNLETLGQQR